MRNSFFRYCCLVIFILFTQKITAQSLFFNTYESDGDEKPSTGIECANGDFLIVGERVLFGSVQGLVLRVDKLGRLKWSKVIDASANEEVFNDILEVNSNLYIAVGYTMSSGRGGSDVFLYAFDSIGNKIWQNIIGGERNDIGMNILNRNGKIYVAAQSNFSGASGFKYLLMTISPQNGKIDFQKTYGNDYTIAQDIGFNSKNEAILIGSGAANFTSSLFTNAYVQKTSSAFVASKPKFYNLNNLLNIFYDVEINSNDEIIASGQITDNTRSFRQGMISKLDKNGNMIWRKSYGTTLEKYGVFFSDLDNNDNMFVAFSQLETAQNDVVFSKIDQNNGEIIWTRGFDGGNDDVARSIIITKDKGLLIICNSNSFSGNNDILLLKTDPMGNINQNCFNKIINLSSSDILLNIADSTNTAQSMGSASETTDIYDIKDAKLNYIIQCDILKSLIEADRYEICENEIINFKSISQSIQPIVAYEWAFEGGIPATSSDTNPQNISYASFGVYGVTLIITNALNEKDTLFLDSLIKVRRTEATNFDYFLNAKCGILQLQNQFPVSNFKWIFEDTITSNILNPVFQLKEEKAYKIALVSNPGLSCADTFTQFVAFSKESFADIAPIPNKCKNDSLMLNASGGVVYSWTPQKGLSAYDIANPKCFNTDDITYSVLISDANGCQDSASIAIKIQTNEGFSAGNDAIFCNYNPLKQLNSSGASDSVHWYPEKLVNTPNSKSPIFISNISATLYIIGYKNGCSFLDTMFVEIDSVPNTTFATKISNCENKVTLTFSNMDTSRNYAVNFGDNTQTLPIFTPSISHIYSDTGVFSIYIYSENNRTECVKADSTKVRILFTEDLKLRIPNAFTPNNDGFFDFFEIENISDECYPKALYIYNRWGENVFNSGEARTLSWDGKHDYSDVKEGVYIYQIVGENYKNTGTVVLTR